MGNIKPDPKYWKSRNVLVTGGAGMIGSHLAEILVENGARVTVADTLIRGKLYYLAKIKNKIQFYQSNLHFVNPCRAAIRGQEIVFNLAARVTGIGYNMHNHTVMYEKNSQLQMWPLVAASHSDSIERFIQVSTACVYPPNADIPTNESWGTVGNPEETNRGYGWAKRMGEFLARENHLAGKFGVWIVRPSNAYGPRDDFNIANCHVIPALIVRILSGEEPVTVWGSGNQLRSFIYVRDIAEAMVVLAEKEPRGIPVNIGTQDEISILDLAKKIGELCGREKLNIALDKKMPDGYPRRLSDVSLLQELTGGWEPSFDLDAGLVETIKFYKDYQSVKTSDKKLFDNRPKGTK